MKRGVWGAGVLFLTVALPGTGEAVFFSKKDRGRHGPPVLQHGVGVRAAGLADATVGVAEDVSALYWNPSGMGRVPTQEALFMRGNSFAGKTQDYLGYVVPFWAKGERRTLGVGYSRLSIASFDLLEENQKVGRADPSESTVGVSYAQPLGPLWGGLTVKSISQKLDEKTAQTWAIDGGVFGESVGQRFTWGLSALHWGPPLNAGGVDVPLPLTFLLGGAYRLTLNRTRGPSDTLLFTGQIDAPNDDLAVGRAGVEYSKGLLSAYRIALRGGWASRGIGTDSSQWSIGGGIEAGPVRINFAQLIQGTLGDETRVDISVRFGREPVPVVKRREALAKGRVALAGGNLLEAQEAVDQALLLSPRSRPARRLAQQIREAYGDSIDPEVLFFEGKKSFEQREWDRSLAFFQKLVVVAPDYPEGKAWLMKVEDRAGQVTRDRIRATVHKARQAKIAGLGQSAQAAFARKEERTALSLWRKILALDPANDQARRGVALCRQSLTAEAEAKAAGGNVAAAISLYDDLRADDPSDKKVGQRLSRLKEDQARRRAHEAKKKYEKGIAVYTEGDFKGALHLFREAHDLAPTDVVIRQALERMEFELKQRERP